MSYHPHQGSSKESHTIIKKRKRISHESEEPGWTAARCNRLLRSITQRIGALRTLADNDFTGTVPKPVKSREKQVANHWSTQDPVWMGDGAKRKTGARTFAGRKKASKQEVSQDATTKDNRVAFPSPFVRRWGVGGEDLETVSPAVPFVRPALPTRLSRNLPIKSETPRIEAEKGLHSAFSSLLKATNGKEPPKSHGSRSLMSTCLRNVPQYIALIEEDEDDDDSNVGSEIMSYLEDLGSKENGGWTGLSEVVRSQAMFAICEAIEDGVLSERATRELLRQCGSEASTSEGFDILTAWSEARDFANPKQIETMTTFGKEHRCQASSFRLMQSIGNQDPARLAVFCKGPKFWNGLLRSLTDPSNYAAAEFLSVCIESCLGQEAHCLQRLALGVKETTLKLTTMAASALLLKDSHVEAGRLNCVVHSLAAKAIFSGHAQPSTELYALLVNCSIFLLGISQDSHGALSPDKISAILPPTARTRHLRSDFATDIISSITALEEHLHSDLTIRLLERMVEEAQVAPLYKQVALAAMTSKQQSSESEEDEALYAEYIARISTNHSPSAAKPPRTPFRKNIKAQFRWEEGICEWVAKTPFTATAASAPPTPSSISVAISKFDDKENQIPSPEKSYTSIIQQANTIQNSPDVLAPSPRKEKKTLAESPLQPRRAKITRFSHPAPVLQQKGWQRRTSSRPLSQSQVAEDTSADELGF